MEAGDQQLVHSPFVPAGYWSPCAPLIWNPVKAPGIRFSSSHFRKQHPRHEKAMVINISSESGVVKNGSLFGLYDQENNKSLLTKADNTKFALLGQMFMCEGKPGPVIELNVSGRIQDGKFDAMIREALHVKYGHLNNAVGLGGVIVQEKGKSLYHVLPEFSQEPIDSGEKLRNWIKMFEMESPVISVGIAVSHDPHHLGLRLEHFHCFNEDQTNCGHCHFDTYGPTVSYRCYFSIANHLLRIDQPSKSL
ncbi:unnamed protein product [Schistosoma margrebowiei]|uniref:Uncharacterized protein n=1 Tax=Schistosoma margrebowiei TaxID=48269 RepID=A0A183LPL7_9TREM|nr:unnamed protein product [Schistosoma margrebowiei]